MASFLLCSGCPVWWAQDLWRWVPLLWICCQDVLNFEISAWANCYVKFFRGCYRIRSHLWGGACGCRLHRGLTWWENLHELQGTSEPTSYIQVTHAMKDFHLMQKCHFKFIRLVYNFIASLPGGAVTTGKSSWWSSQMNTTALLGET